jgi:hypothetical protein
VIGSAAAPLHAPALTERKILDSVRAVLPITLGDQSFKFGPIEILYSNVVGAGIGVRNRRSGVHRTLLIAYTMEGAPKPRLITFGLQPGAEGAQFAELFRARAGVGDRWKPERDYASAKKALGFSNLPVNLFVAAIVILTVAVVIGLAVTQSRSAPAPRPASTSMSKPAR